MEAAEKVRAARPASQTNLDAKRRPQSCQKAKTCTHAQLCLNVQLWRYNFKYLPRWTKILEAKIRVGGWDNNNNKIARLSPLFRSSLEDNQTEYWKCNFFPFFLSFFLDCICEISWTAPHPLHNIQRVTRWGKQRNSRGRSDIQKISKCENVTFEARKVSFWWWKSQKEDRRCGGSAFGLPKRPSNGQ